MIPIGNNFKRAKQLALLTTVAATFLAGRDSLLAAAPAKPLVDLESHLEWSAVKSNWKDARDGWVSETESCQDAPCVSAQLLALEASIEAKAMNSKWQSRRAAWVEEVHNAKTDAQVANLLLKFEQNLGSTAFDKDWKGMSEDWVAGLGVKESLPRKAESVNYPEDKPAFTVTVPEGWQVARRNGALILKTNADAAIVFQPVDDVHDDATAMTGLKVLAEHAANAFEMKDAQVLTPSHPAQAFKGFATEYRGKNGNGDPGFLQCSILATRKGEYHLVSVICSDKDDKKTEADREAIFASIQPAKQ
jgi:hypothetical protein